MFMGFVIWRYIATVSGGRRRMKSLQAKMEPVMTALKINQKIPPEQLENIASNPETRNLLFRTLQKIGRQDLFPKKYRYPKAIAESDLVIWLLHPNELGSKPDQIELMNVIEREGDKPTKKYQFFVFRFRMHDPHWSAKSGWMAGVAGPYLEGEESGISPPGVFSRFETFDIRTPEEHVASVEKLLRL